MRIVWRARHSVQRGEGRGLFCKLVLKSRMAYCFSFWMWFYWDVSKRLVYDWRLKLVPEGIATRKPGVEGWTGLMV